MQLVNLGCKRDVLVMRASGHHKEGDMMYEEKKFDKKEMEQYSLSVRNVLQ